MVNPEIHFRLEIIAKTFDEQMGDGHWLKKMVKLKRALHRLLRGI